MSNLNYNCMNVQHKCLFHPNNSIVKFCENKQCTLPLCQECEPIHLEQHHSQQSQAKILRFNEATLRASNNMEDYIEAFKRFEKEIENKIENDKEVVIRLVDEYYSTARKMMNEIRDNVNKVSENLNKLNKGSIKALIFFYSGDVIKLNKFDLQFEPLQFRIRNLLQKKEQRVQIDRKKYDINHQISSVSLQHEHRHQHQTIVQKPRARQVKHSQNQDNVFSGIQELKEERNHSRNRKSIFDQNKKNSGITQNNVTYKQVDHKTSYVPHYQQIQQQIRAPSYEPSLKYHYDVGYEQKNYQKNTSEPEILSFQNRFLNKFSCIQQASQGDQNNMLTVKQSSRPQAKYDDIYSKKILKPEDLQIQKQNSHLAEKSSQIAHTLTQRNRSMSQNNMNQKEIRRTNYEYDLKRQVLSPDEIRKMLEKKIQERNRVLSIKKQDNYPPPEERGRKGWETRDSIINQIYSEPKY